MSDEATIRAAIKTKLQAVSNIGQVYDYQRFAAEWDTFLDLFKTTISNSTVIRGWCITCDGFNPPVERETYGGTGSLYTRDYSYKIRGYFGVDDANASEKTAFIVVEAVIDTLTAHLSSVGLDNIPTLDTYEIRVFGSVACHFAEISMIVNDDFVGG